MHRTLRIGEVDRIGNSKNGNPRFFVVFYDHNGLYYGGYNTPSDHSFAYEIGNPGMRPGDFVVVTIGGRGTITNMAPKP